MASQDSPPPPTPPNGIVPTPASAAPSTDDTSIVPKLDVEKLHSLPSERQDIVLLTFVSDLVRQLASISEEELNGSQAGFKKELFKIITLSSPGPTRVIRNNVAQCFTSIFTRGSRKVLFETGNDLLAIVNGPVRNDKEFKSRHAAVQCLGAVFEAAGDSAISLANNALLILQRQVKAASNHVGYRATVIKALGRIVKGIERMADEVISRDLWKVVRNAMTGDKAYVVQSNACWAAQQLFEHTTYFDNSSDFEKLQSSLWKITDQPSVPLRRAAAACLSAVFVKHYSDSPLQQLASRTKKSKKPKPLDTDGDETGNGLERTDSASSQRPNLTLSFGLADILRQLSTHYCKPSTANRTRASIIQTYIRVMRSLPEEVIEKSYPLIAKHLYIELLSSPSVVNNRYRLLITRKFVHLILNKVVSIQLLGETAQLDALRFLINGILKDYPQSDIQERPEPSKETLVGVLTTMTSLFGALGSATNIVGDICRNSLLQVLEHPSFTVQVHASRCFKAFVLACPSQLLPCATICMNSVNREVNHLTNHRRSPRRCVGYALGLAAVVSTSASQPLYGSVDVYARIMTQAISILKSSSNNDLRISSIQIQVAYILISGLMSLGPSFVKIHLSQLLLIWKNALPKPMLEDKTSQRGMRELSFLAHIRECALSSMRCFLRFNSKLLTLDVTKRLAGLLDNTTLFIQALPAKKTTEDPGLMLSSSLQLRDYDLMLRRRVFECFTDLFRLSSSAQEENLLQSGLLSLVVSSFADSENVSASSLSSSIAASSGNFERIWDVADNSGFGITGLVNGLEVQWLSSAGEQKKSHWLALHDTDSEVDRLVNGPTCSSLEHDSVLLYAGDEIDDAPPVSTSVVDAAINLFATSLPLQTHRIQQGALEQISSLIAQATSAKHTAREVAVSVNAATSLLFMLQVANRETSYAPGNIRSQSVERGLDEMLQTFLSHREDAVRMLASESVGRQCKAFGHEFTTKVVKNVIDRIVDDRDPATRSGCAMALGCIASSLGGMAAGLHFKNILGVLNSLSGDPHPTVHFWALDGLSKVAESAGISFSSYVTGALGMLCGLYVSESHGEESALAPASNMEIEMPSLTVLARCVNAMINVLGPDLQDMSKPRSIILTLTYQFQTEASPIAAVESLKCLENLSMYAPSHIAFKPYVKQLQSKLDHLHPEVHSTALAGLRNAMRRGAEDLLELQPSLEDHLWQTLNEAYGEGAAKDLIRDWAEQSGLSMITQWISRISRVFMSTRAPRKRPQSTTQVKAPVDTEGQDEEVAGFAASASATAKDGSNDPPEASQELLRWQTRHFGLEILLRLLTEARKSALLDEEAPAIQMLQPRVADIVKVAFAASTAPVVELRIYGIRIIGLVLQIFGRSPDPEFPDATMLEQYQAQVSSALTPAFASDSSPILAAEAVSVCGSFISTGIVKDTDKMGRILRLLVSALDDFSKEAEAVSIGDLKGLSANAQVMVRLAVFSAWAELQVASQDQTYLGQVVNPHVAKLTPLWLSSLREYAKLKFEPEISMTGAVSGSSVEETYAALNREALLEFYQESWLNFVNAIASLIEENADFVFDALDGKEVAAGATNGAKEEKQDISYRDEPVAFFFVLFGISFEALVARSSADEISVRRKRLDILQAMKRILRPSIAGSAIYQEAIFNETMDLLDRLALTDGLEIQAAIVEIARNLCIEHPSARGSTDPEEESEELTEEIEQLFELTRIIVLVLTQHVPKLAEASATTASEPSDEVVSLIVMALTALVSSAEVFPSIIKSDLHSCIFNVFATIFSTGAFQNEVVPQALPIFRRFITGLAAAPQPDTASQIRNAMARLLGLLKVAQAREAEGAVQCEKNTLLASTILITSASGLFPEDDPLANKYIDELVDCMGNLLTTKVAAGLSRSVVMLAGNTESGAEDIVARIVPKLTSFLLLPPEAPGLEDTKPLVSQVLTAFALAVPGESKVNTMHLVINVLLQRALDEGDAVYKEIGARLMELASREPAAFRTVAAGISGDKRGLMQMVVQQSGAAGRRADDNDEDKGSKEPTIALKMNF